MDKKAALEVLREAIRRARIQKDEGDNSMRDRIIYLSSILQKLNAAKGEAVKDLIASYNLY